MKFHSRALLAIFLGLTITGGTNVSAQTMDAATVAERVNQLMTAAKQISPPTGKPSNVLLVIADDMGVEESGCYGASSAGDLAPMPNLSHLCKNGVVFDNLWSAPVCSPTRATIMTGRYGFRTGIGAPISRSEDGAQLSTDEFTIAKALNQNPTAYAKAIIGKWHISRDAGDPARMGWDHYAGLFTGGTRSYFSWQKTEKGQTTTSNKYSTTEFVDDAITWVGQQKDKPWFLWLAFNAPHAPFHAPPKHLHSQKNLPEDGGRDAWPGYYRAMIEAMDTEFGRLLLALGPETVANTNIIFIGDNGTPGQVAQAPVQRRRAKGSLYQGGLNVPFYVAGPIVKDGSRHNASLINTTDLYATILEMTGVNLAKALPEGLKHDSISFLPILQNQSTRTNRKWAYTEQFGLDAAGSGKKGRKKKGGSANREGRTIRDVRYKLIEFKGGRTEFYDVKGDPHERRNLQSNTLSVAQRLAFERLRETMKQLHQQ
ncbi:MAG: sulfatase-like hydrolase/transferase [Proteobacteria bacterium]|nr:sulfatase-like hydrolase/transferase [Pseudomonadota bacterium]